jgi:hypothetical protein
MTDKPDGRRWGLHAWAWCLVAVHFISGCIGDRALPIVSSTPIPGTKISIRLGGPDAKGRYSYYVIGDRIWSYRDLGPLRSDQTGSPVLKDLGGGVFRIQWGDGSTYATIDTRKEIFVEDSNPENPKNQAFSASRVGAPTPD